MAKAKANKKNTEKTENIEPQKEIAVPKEHQAEPKECCKEDGVTEAPKGSRNAWVMAIIFGVMVIIALSYGYNTILNKQMLERGCSELSNSPDLKYPTVCVPLDTDSNRGDYVDQKSDPMCRCKVDTGNGTSTVIDIRLAK